MKKFLITLIVCLTSIVSFANDEIGYDYDIIELTKDNINPKNDIEIKSQQVKIFGTEYTIIVKNPQLNRYYFNCIIEIEDFWPDDFSVTQECTDMIIDQSSYINILSDSYVYFESNIHLEYSTENKTIEVIYHFTGNNGNDSFDLIIRFPYNNETVTSIEQLNNSSQPIYYDLNGRSSNKPFNGLNIVKRGNVITKEIHK